jgi:hypothetical protein
MSKLNELLKCAICNQTFTGSPITLICCNSKICEHHLHDQLKLNQGQKTIQCFSLGFLCRKSHKIFDTDRIDKGINIGNFFEQVNEEIEELIVSYQQINYLIKDPKNFISQAISKIKQDVDLRREKLKEKIDEISNQMIEKLDNYQNECYENIDKIKLEEKTKDLVKEIESSLEKWTKDNKRMVIVSNDSKRKEIHSEAIQLDIKAFKRLSELEEELMMYKVWVYLENEMVEKEFGKELIQFDG